MIELFPGDGLVDGEGFSTSSFLLIPNVPGFWVIYQFGGLLILTEAREPTVLSWSLEQSMTGDFSASSDGLLS